MDYFWWEKTVEYAFVQNYVEIEMAVAPLGGVQEKGGDAILKKDDRWVLIEFKKDNDSLSSEEGKFAPGKYSEAKETLEKRGQHHFLVYGVLNESKLDLKGKLYFGTNEIEVEDLLKKGTDEETFLSYYHDFIGYKKSKEGSSGGGITCVVGVNSEGKASKVMSAHEYEETLILTKKLNFELEQRIKRQQRNNRSSHSRGM
ncbi:hypothetical protein ACEV8A_24305 [Vibrio parahaemolyticus]|uniref:hypothetical protein n=1 Tax=Vibrio parahaemolyticus TaxID=670 RepID=UPI0009429663|nr:hypothetical protein [Vibrio parahaemolyticus]MBE3858332.1 hypothetical protein [Vibrio parahaemolyticus]MCX8951591.1 hypothetical protein [Vibrio parahaemolyticus]OKY36636.1 hypothetical protein BT101_24725 [Vibrio parahaemolyticus]OQK26468.1 hypothetical protein XM69_c11761 [Vibrio parahaemolyticus]HCH3755128.1 hypothetical protein [Vibrio parahaemolyticus]